MKAAVKQSAMPTSPTANQDFTDVGFSSDVKLMLPFFTRATANNTITSQAGLSVGFTDGTNQAAISQHVEDNLVTNSDGDTRAFTTQSACLADTTNASIAEGSGSLLSNGGRIAWTDWNANELINALLIGGSDVTASVCSGTLNGTTDVAVTHGLGATPDIIIGMTICRDSGGSGSQPTHSIGFYDVVHSTYAAVSVLHNNAATTQFAQIIHTNAIVSLITTTAVTWKVTLNDIGSTTFDMVADAATPNVPTTGPVVYFLCLKVTGGDYKVGTFLTKSTTGTQADITGMSAKPKAVLYLPTRIISSDGLDTHINNTRSESFGLGVAADNSGATEQACAIRWGKDGTVLGNPTPTTDTASYTSNTKAGAIIESGAVTVEWEVSAWNSDGVTNNYTTSEATTHYVAYLAIAPAGSSTPKGRLLLLGAG